MEKQKNYLKNSFTLIETIFAIFLLLIVIMGFKSFEEKDAFSSKTYMKLNDIENLFTVKNYSSFQINSKNIEIVKDDKSSFETLKIVSYEDENIRVFKYEK